MNEKKAGVCPIFLKKEQTLNKQHICKNYKNQNRKNEEVSNNNNKILVNFALEIFSARIVVMATLSRRQRKHNNQKSFLFLKLF